jgi:hypothetical protein
MNTISHGYAVFLYLVGFEVLTAVSTKMACLLGCSAVYLVEVYQLFRGPCCLHHQGDEWPDDGGSRNLWNVGTLLPDYTALQPRRQPSSLCITSFRRAHNKTLECTGIILLSTFIFVQLIPTSLWELRVCWIEITTLSSFSIAWLEILQSYFWGELVNLYEVPFWWMEYTLYELGKNRNCIGSNL